MKVAAGKCGGPAHALFPMERCLYGHPLSGHLWVERFLKYLLSKGFTADPGDPAFLQRNKTRVCVYVDDASRERMRRVCRRLARGRRDPSKDTSEGSAGARCDFASALRRRISSRDGVGTARAV